jgi:hypothetical protein
MTSDGRGEDVLDLAENIMMSPLTTCLRREEESPDVIDFAENIIMRPVFLQTVQ